jgi:8-oxo-dGTP diphosphatase
MTKYVVGFLFRHGKVALIEKKRPEWQKGKLNGIGGHIEPGESPYQAMIRECTEESGFSTNRWREYTLLTNKERTVELHVFTVESEVARITTKTDEHVMWYPADRLPENIIPNLAWLIPMAKHPNTFMGKIEFDTDMW